MSELPTVSSRQLEADLAKQQSINRDLMKENTELREENRRLKNERMAVPSSLSSSSSSSSTQRDIAATQPIRAQIAKFHQFYRKKE